MTERTFDARPSPRLPPQGDHVTPEELTEQSRQINSCCSDPKDRLYPCDYHRGFLDGAEAMEAAVRTPNHQETP